MGSTNPFAWSLIADEMERDVEDIVAFLGEFADQAVIWQLKRGHVENTPACYFLLKPTQASDALKIGLFSEDLRRFKIVLAVDLADVPPFEDKLFQGRATTALRARIHDFFLTREIDIEGQSDHGFFDWPSGGSPDSLRGGLQKAIDAAIACSTV